MQWISSSPFSVSKALFHQHSVESVPELCLSLPKEGQVVCSSHGRKLDLVSSIKIFEKKITNTSDDNFPPLLDIYLIFIYSFLPRSFNAIALSAEVSTLYKTRESSLRRSTMSSIPISNCRLPLVPFKANAKYRASQPKHF